MFDDPANPIDQLEYDYTASKALGCTITRRSVVDVLDDSLLLIISIEGPCTLYNDGYFTKPKPQLASSQRKLDALFENRLEPGIGCGGSRSKCSICKFVNEVC